LGGPQTVFRLELPLSRVLQCAHGFLVLGTHSKQAFLRLFFRLDEFALLFRRAFELDNGGSRSTSSKILKIFRKYDASDSAGSSVQPRRLTARFELS